MCRRSSYKLFLLSFLCGNDYHAPTDCETMKKWLVKCADDSETANYITANTKDCPGCHICIEKSGGCNHMQCWKCKFHFCWMCLGGLLKKLFKFSFLIYRLQIVFVGLLQIGKITAANITNVRDIKKIQTQRTNRRIRKLEKLQKNICFTSNEYKNFYLFLGP